MITVSLCVVCSAQPVGRRGSIAGRGWKQVAKPVAFWGQLAGSPQVVAPQAVSCLAGLVPDQPSVHQPTSCGAVTP